MNSKTINIYSSIFKWQNDKTKKTKETNVINPRPQSKATIIFNQPVKNKTTKPSPEHRDLSEFNTKNVALIGIKKPNTNNIIKTSQVNKKSQGNVPSFSSYKLGGNKNTITKQFNPNDNSIFTMKYMESVMKKIPFKANKYMTNPCTANQTRKTSKDKDKPKITNKTKDNKDRDKSNKLKTKNEVKIGQSQSSSVTKIKNMILPNTNDFKNLLTKYSLVSNITSQSHSKKQTIQQKNVHHYINQQQHKETFNSTNYIKTHGNNTITYQMKTTKNNNIITANLTSIKPNKNKYMNKGAIKPMPKTAKKNLSSQVTLTHNIFNNKLFNIKNQTTYQANQPYLHTIFPTPLHTYKHIEISNDYNSINKKARTTMEVKGKNSSVDKKSKNSIDKEIKQLTYSKQLNNKYHSSSNSNTVINKGSSKLRENVNENNESNLQESMCRENMYYNDEQRKLVEYIKSYYSSHFNEYPPTSFQFYKIGRRIGHGAFGKVNICLHILTGRVVAIKSFNRAKNLFSKKKIQYEVKLMKKLKGHKNIIKVYEIIETEKYYCIVMENISGGNLQSLISKSTKLTEEVARFIFKQLMEALKYMHSQGIAHRDIKPENILIDLNNNIKICDFGVGKEISPGTLIRDTCGTPAFVAPELLSEEPYDPFQSDVWSSGVLLYSMLTNVFPFRGNNDAELHSNIRGGNYPKITDISSECSNLVHQILNINPSKRITVNQILAHPWLNKGINNAKICLFTNAEKIIYSKLSVDYRNAKKEDLLETFTYRNIDTELENENQNVKTKSIIIAPFNSRIIDQYDEDIYYSDLQIENQIMKFLPKINELKRDYEVNYNAEVDQGYIINNKKMNSKRQINSIHNSFEQYKAHEAYNSDNIEKNLQNNHNNNNQGNDYNYNDGDKNDGLNKKKNIKDTPSTTFNTFSIDDNILKSVEEMGYSREYIMKSLENNELNHSTTTYFIIQNTVVNE